MYISRLLHMQREREKKKYIYIMREQNIKWWNFFSEYLPHFTVDSFLQSRVNSCSCIKTLHPFPSEVVHPGLPNLGKVLLLTFLQHPCLDSISSESCNCTLIHAKVKMGNSAGNIYLNIIINSQKIMGIII